MPWPPGRRCVIARAASRSDHEATPGGGPRRVVDEQRAGPPADLVVGEIADAVGRAAVGRDRLARHRHHPRRGLRRERVEPVKLGAAAELEVDDRRQAQPLRRQRPAAGAVEAPGEEAAAGGRDPGVKARREGVPGIIDLAAALALRIAAVEGIDAEAVEALAARRLEPGDAVLADNRPAARGGVVEGAGGGRSEPEQQRGDGRRRHPHAAVPPTVSPSMRTVGWPTPTGTPWPSLPQVPTPSSRARSLPIIVILVSASGPLPIRVAPLTAGPIRPSSIR